MKKSFVYGTIAAIVLAGFAACAGSAKPAPARDSQAPLGPPPVQGEDGAVIDADKSTIRDWQGRTAKAPAIPVWIQSVALGNYNQAGADLGQQDSGAAGAPIYRGLQTIGPDLRGAQMRADMDFARTLARELQQQINVYASASTSALPYGTQELIREMTQTKSEVTVSGARLVGEFWQTVSTRDGVTGRTRTETVLYRLYRFNPEDWANITAGYVQKVLDQLPAGNRLNERDVNGMLQDMLQNARTRDALTLEQMNRKIAAEEKVLNAQIEAGKSETQQRIAGQQALAQIYADRDVAIAKEGTEQAQVKADSERAAYASGDPALISAASVTPQDAVLINAAKLAARILF
jgi:hypothetical protein